MSSFEVRGLDEYTNRMVKRLTKEYPKVTESFLNKQINACKSEVESITPVAKKKPQKYKRSKHMKDNWKTSVKVSNGRSIAILKNNSPHAHLIENGHMTKNGGWVEGKHMLVKTMTKRQPKIDKAIESLVDEIFNF